MSNENETNQGQVMVLESPHSTAVQRRDLSAPGAIDHAVAQMEAMLEFKDRVIEACVKRAKQSDITSFGKGDDEKPYFSADFCQRIASHLDQDTDIKIISKELEQYADGHFGYSMTVKVHVPGLGTTDGIGLATTKDQFLGVKYETEWNNKTRKKERKLDSAGNPICQDPDEVSRHNLLQHARTRAVASALRKLLGVGSYTWDDLEEMGFAREGSRNIAFDGKKAGDRGEVPAALTKKLKGFVTKKIFSWDRITDVQNDLGLRGRALELNEEDMTKLVQELDKRASEME